MAPSIPVGDEADRLKNDERFQSDDLVTFGFEPSAVQVEWWLFRLGEPYNLYPRGLAEFFARDLPGLLSCHYTAISPDEDMLSLELAGAENHVNIWLTGQTIQFASDRLHNDLTHVVEDRQGRGLGKQLMSNCFDLAEMIGLSSIELTAALEAGPYAWAKFGFRPDPASWEDVKHNVAKKLASLQNSVPRKVVDDVYHILANMDVAAIQEIAERDYLVPSERYVGEDGNPLKISLGRALLAESGARWKGTLDLTDENNVAIFLAYVGRL